jgi:hypothetical protein
MYFVPFVLFVATVDCPIRTCDHVSDFSPHLKDKKMTPEQRLDLTERILMLMVRAGRRARKEWNEKVNILIDAQIRNEAEWRAESEAINEQLKVLAVAQSELAKSQKLTDRALRAFINSIRKSGNGHSN